MYNMQENVTQKTLEEEMADANISASAISPSLVQGYKGFYNRYIKRMCDLFLSLILLIILSPVLLIISVLIALESGFPVFYRAERGGLHGKSFRIFKFRSMVKNADRIGGGTTALNDSRITKVGAFLRKTKLDEFANLISIVKGDMSFIGPRPELIRYTSQYTGTEKLIEEVRPGITDFSSLEFINLDEIVGTENADEIFEQKVLPRKNKLRVKYAAKVSFATDCYLFFRTVWKVVEKAMKFICKS